MSKILIVDDELLTRKGIRNSMKWSDYQIDTVLEAGNGREGLRIALEYKPEIILTDVRMPQMSGVDMVEKLREALPNISIIFMSGYSDKEYLMAAIKYKAVRYIEKPLDMMELDDAIREAAKVYIQTIRAEAISINSDNSRTDSRIASILSQPAPHDSSMEDSCAKAGFSFPSDCSFTAILLKFSDRYSSEIDSIDNSDSIPDHSDSIAAYIMQFSLKEVHINKYDQYLVFFIYGMRPSEETIMRIARRIHLLYSPAGDHFLSVGTTVSGVNHAYNTYSTAVILMQSSFFFEKNSIITEEKKNEYPQVIDTESYSSTFAGLLSDKNKSETFAFLDRVLCGFKNSRHLLPNQVKDDYFKLLAVLDEAQRSYRSQSSVDSESIIGCLDNTHTLFELHDILVQRTKAFFSSIMEYEPENATVFAIKDFISRNYKNPVLSVKTISDHVHRTTSYICTLFKAETNQTINQFLTEYRIEKAKQLLEDPTFKITDISLRVGYSDGNYFSKSFRKYVGMSPSEYRDIMSK